jgi:hypothetical protein
VTSTLGAMKVEVIEDPESPTIFTIQSTDRDDSYESESDEREIVQIEPTGDSPTYDPVRVYLRGVARASLLSREQFAIGRSPGTSASRSSASWTWRSTMLLCWRGPRPHLPATSTGRAGSGRPAERRPAS